MWDVDEGGCAFVGAGERELSALPTQFCCEPKTACYTVPSHFSRVQLFATLWTIASQAPLIMGFSRQEY